jgi:hypothetical protein
MQFARHFATLTRRGHDHSYAPVLENLGGQGVERYPVDFRPDEDGANIHVRQRELDEFIIFFYDSRDDGGMMSAMCFDGVIKNVHGLQPSLPVTAEIRLVVDSYDFTIGEATHRSDVAPFISEGRTMVPLRVVTDGLGAEIEWDGETQTVTILQVGETLRLTVGTPLPNNMGTPQIVNGRTFVPVAYVAEALGATVRWDGAAQAVYIERSF